MYRQFNIQHFYVLPHTVYLCVLCGSENKQPLMMMMIYSPFFSLPNAVCFIILTYLVLVLFTFYIYSTNIGTEYFKHVICSPFFSLPNAVCFIILTYLVPVLFTFYIYSTNIGTEYFKHGIYSPIFPLQNAVCFIILMFWFLYYSHFIYLFNKYRYRIF